MLNQSYLLSSNRKTAVVDARGGSNRPQQLSEGDKSYANLEPLAAFHVSSAFLASVQAVNNAKNE